MMMIVDEMGNDGSSMFGLLMKLVESQNADGEQNGM